MYDFDPDFDLPGEWANHYTRVMERARADLETIEEAVASWEQEHDEGEHMLWEAERNLRQLFRQTHSVSLSLALRAIEQHKKWRNQ